MENFKKHKFEGFHLQKIKKNSINQQELAIFFQFKGKLEQ